ncbi:MAG: beta-galactosidase, partial [Armatimonadota bacterium]|nr:beta-galactosidase [Armatimonadota bacterium]
GMYASVRIGPYVNSEWGGGGWPVWLRFKPGVRVREDNPQFEKYQDRWLGKLMPIVAANQINHGGPVIMVQMENEDPRATGNVIANSYFQHLKDKCDALGLQVPSFFSGLHHGDNPAGESPFDDSAQGSPWFTTEFWTGWFGVYGAEEREQARTRATWNILANGGAGYDHYTGVAGTNFETWGSDQTGASYDFGAPIGQGGDIRDFFYMLKRPALFGTAFSTILADSHNTSDQYANAATNGAGVSARTSPAGTIIFLKNSADGTKPLKTQFKDKNGTAYPSAGPFTLAPQEIMPIVRGYTLVPGVSIDICAARILTIVPQGNVTTLIVYGPPGDPAEIHFTVTGKDAPAVKSPTLTASPGRIVFKTKFPASTPQASEFTVGGKTVRVLAVSSDMADQTWPLVVDGRTLIICGPDYVGDVSMKNGKLMAQAEQRTSNKAGQQKAFWVFGPGPAQPLTETTASVKAHGPGHVPTLTAWRTAIGDKEAKPNFDDAGWLKSQAPRPMGADGDDSAYAWYRTTIHAPTAGKYGLNFADAGDWLTTWVNGVHGESSTVETRFRDPVPRAVPVALKAGDNQLTVLTSHYGRNKLHAWIGPINKLDAKGIVGPVTLVQTAGGSADISQWRWKADDRGLASATEMAAPKLDTKGADWHDGKIGDDVFNGKLGFAWFRAALPDVPGVHRRLHFEHVDDTGYVYVNGVKVGENIDNSNAFDVNIDSVWKEGGPNVVAVLVQNTNGGGGLAGPVSLLGEAGSGGTTLQGWKMRGGVNLPAENSSDWHTFTGNTPTGAPAFYQSHFTAKPPPTVGPHLTLRASFAGLSRGFLWLNGHNIGRYPERSPIESLYLPECWLNAGQNTLAVFDEDGKAPTDVKIVEETAASRQNIAITGTPATH